MIFLNPFWVSEVKQSSTKLSETIASVISLVSYDEVFGICPRSWENAYTITWVTAPFASQVVSNSLLSGDLIDSLAFRSLKIIFDVRSLWFWRGWGVGTMKGVQRFEWRCFNKPPSSPTPLYIWARFSVLLYKKK